MAGELGRRIKASLADLEDRVKRARRVARVYARKQTRWIEEKLPATKGTNWKKVRIWGGLGAVAILAGGALPTDGVWELVDAEGPLSSYDKTGVSVLQNGVLCSDGSSVTFPS